MEGVVFPDGEHGFFYFQSSGFRLQASGFRLQASGFNGEFTIYVTSNS
jgi:hypothetical protein